MSSEHILDNKKKKNRCTLIKSIKRNKKISQTNNLKRYNLKPHPRPLSKGRREWYVREVIGGDGLYIIYRGNLKR